MYQLFKIRSYKNGWALYLHLTKWVGFGFEDHFYDGKNDLYNLGVFSIVFTTNPHFVYTNTEIKKHLWENLGKYKALETYMKLHHQVSKMIESEEAYADRFGPGVSNEKRYIKLRQNLIKRANREVFRG